MAGWKDKEGIRRLLARERGTLFKPAGGRLRVALLYPNTYRAGMSNLGFQTIYGMINSRADALCERAFLPEPSSPQPQQLLTMESQTPVERFHVVAFSVSFEEDYINVPRMLRLARIGLYADQRKALPMVIAGGCAVSLNPEPLSEFIDLFFIGEAEQGFMDLIDRLGDSIGLERDRALKGLAALEHVYVPSLYSYRFKDTKIERIEHLPPAPPRVRRARLSDIDSYTPRTEVFTPLTEFGNRLLVEVERGCPRGCRFCAAGFLYLPPRWRSPQTIEAIIESAPKDIKGVGLVGSAVSEYPHLKGLLKRYGGRFNITLSSLRLDVLDRELLELLKGAGYTTITVAPEAGTERLRRVINKPLTEDAIVEGLRLIGQAGFKRLKLYFMVGLPTEEDEDIRAIARIALQACQIIKDGNITLSITPFVPKPFTPFQWHPFAERGLITHRYRLLKDALKATGRVTLKPFSIDATVVQAYLSRADRRAASILVGALKRGWRAAIRGDKDFIEHSIYRKRGFDEPLPWDTIDCGIERTYLWKEYERALRVETTPACNPQVCTRCGVC